ncbi:MAG: RES family NAD+ phosphorylase [Longimicrobiales bacterium]
MEAWRLASGRHDPLTGEGSRLFGGRWNSPGRPLVYTSESVALAVVEALVHITGAFPADYHAFRIQLPDDAIERLNLTRLKSDWTDDIGYTRAIGDQWLEQTRSLAFVVPSVVIPSSMNVLINPRHPNTDVLDVVSREPFQFDPRLRP